jgi:hypothetical protein
MKKPGLKGPPMEEPKLETKFVVRGRRRRGRDEFEVDEVHAIYQGDVVFVFPKSKSATPQRADRLDPTHVYDTQEEAQKAMLSGNGKVRWVCYEGSWGEDRVPEVFQARVVRNALNETYHYTRLDNGETGFLGYGRSFFETRAEALERASNMLSNRRPLDFELRVRQEHDRHERELKMLEQKKVKLEKLLHSMRGAHVKLPNNYKKRPSRRKDV